MSPLLTVLNDLSWVIECAAQDHMGEGKSELALLCSNLRDDPEYRIEDRAEIAAELEVALMAYRPGDIAEGATKLTSISRRLWKVVSRSGVCA